MRRWIVLFTLLVIATTTSGCRISDTQSPAPSATTKGETTVLKISVFDSKTKRILPTKTWTLEPIVGEGNTIYVENSKQNGNERIFEPVEPGSYEITATASGYFPKHRTITVRFGINKVQFFLKPVPPQTSENAVYDELKKIYPLKIYRPAYLPLGFKIAPYAGTKNFKRPNPYIAGTEAEIAYESATGQINLRFGIKGDIGDVSQYKRIKVAGNRAYVSINRSSVSVVWCENVKGERYLYTIQAKNVSEREVIKVAESLNPVN